METYDRLIASGWKDWHVLLAICNVANNYRARVRRDLASEENFEEWRKRYFDAMFQPEREEDPRPPPEEFSDEAMRFNLDLAIGSFVLAHGWEIKNPTPNFRGLRKFVADRYRYFELDVAHEPFFRGAE